MRKILLSTLIIVVMVSLLSSTAVALTSSEILELFQQGGNTGDLVTADELNFFGHPLSEIGTDIDVVREIMRQNGLDTKVTETNLSEQHQSTMVSSQDLNHGISFHVDRVTNNALVASTSHPGEYDVFDTLTYRYYSNHRADIGIRDIHMGDSIADFLSKVGFSNASVLATTIYSVINAEYESEWDAMSMINSISYSNEQLYFGLFNKNTLYQTDSLEIPVHLAFNNHTISCDMYFRNDKLNDFTITLYTPEADKNSSQSNSSNYSLELPAEKLATIETIADAVEAVSDLVATMTATQKASPMDIDLATLYAETAAAKAVRRPVAGTDILINAATIADLEADATQAVTAIETTLANGGITTARYLSTSVTLTTNSTSEITIRLNPDILTTSVDTVHVEGPGYVISFKIVDWIDALTETLTFKVAPTQAETLTMVSSVDIEIPGGSTSNPITVSLPMDSSTDTTYQAVVSSTGTATASKYNPATTNIDGKVNTSGTYSVEIKEVDFTDITGKNAEMQKAIKYLAARGIIGGTGGTNFSPDSSISRAELTALVVRALGKVDSRAVTNFTDVTTANWFYSIVASSQKLGYINGFEDNTFRGNITINKEQIVVIAARVLGAEMNYKTPGNTAAYLNKYSDTVASWAQPQVALATRENLVVYRTDGTFSGSKNMTRGDAAIIIYRLFQRLW